MVGCIAAGAALISSAVLMHSPVVSLDGRWLGCRTETGDVPGASAEWRPVKVPSFLGQSNGRPFLWYKRPFAVPEELAGRHVFVRFGAVRFVSQVYVNGRQVGGHYGGWEPFETEITGACRSGQPNELLVRVQDVTGLVEQEMDYAKQGRGMRFISQAQDSVMAPVGSQYTRVGIWEPVSLIARSDVYVDDVFVKTSVRKREIEVDVTLRNLSSRGRKVRVVSTVEQADLPPAETEATVPPHSSVKRTLRQEWHNPRLWGPEDPHLYHLSTEVTEAGKGLDTCRTRFGFREFWIDGTDLVLNGTPMKFLATAGHPRGELDDGLSKPSAIDFYRRIREAGCVAMRLHANVWPKCWYEAADEVGMPIIMESALFCYSREYALSKQKFWDNYHDHLRAIVKEHRNHPSIVMISLENEILHCGGDRIEATEHRLAEAGRLVKRLDPTRPIMYDGDADPEGAADVVNLHYPLDFNRENLWPNVGYWLETGMEVKGWPRKLWTWDRKKPLYFGEFLHVQHYPEPDPFTVLIGDEAYLGYDQAMAVTKALAWEMQIKAYRACDVSGMCPWTLTETGDFPSLDAGSAGAMGGFRTVRNRRYLAVKAGYQKIAAFIREHDNRFYENEDVERTVSLYNDTLHPAKPSFTWELARGDTVVDSGEREFDARPAQKIEFKIRLKMPPVGERTPLSFKTSVFGGKDAFLRSERYWVFPKKKLAVPRGVRLAIFEGPKKVLSEAFRDSDAAPVRVTDLAKLPEADVLIIGPHALDGLKPPGGPLVVGAESEPRQAIASLVRRGGSVVVLEQDSYDCGLLPAHLVDRGATIAFPRARLETLLFAGAVNHDFRFWRGDHLVARKTIMKPRHGRFRALVDSGGPEGLVYLPLLEILDGKGQYLLSQLLIGEKLGREPVAHLLLENMVRYAAAPVKRAPTGLAALVADRYAPAPVKGPVRLAVVEDHLPLTRKLNDIHAAFTDISGNLDETDLGAFGVLLAETDCDEVAGNQAEIRQFVTGGGKVILHGGTTEGLARLQHLFPEPISAQRSNAIPVSIQAPDPVIDGLTNQELYWYGAREGLSWRVRTPLSTQVCSHVIVAGRPDPSRCVTVEAESMEVAAGDVRIGKDGVYMWTAAAVHKGLDFPRSGEYSIMVRGRGTPAGGVYPQIRVSIDGRPRGSITTEGENWGTYSLSTQVDEGTHDVALAFVNDAYEPERGEDRNVWLDQLVYGPAPELESKRLLNPAALVKVPLGEGFYLLDQVRWHSDACSPEKGGRYLSNLLVNLHCDFGSRAGAVVIRGDQMLSESDFVFSTGSDGTAYLGSNGTICRAVRFGKTRGYQFAVEASGTEAAGELPNIRLSVDGQPIGDLLLRRSGWQVLRLDAEIPEGVHKVGLSFTNDFYDPPADRNLRIRHLQIR